MRRKNNDLVAIANNGKLRQRFTPGVPRTFDQDCLTAGTIGNYFITSRKRYLLNSKTGAIIGQICCHIIISSMFRN